MVCSGCRVSLSDDYRYCPHCGQPTALVEDISRHDGPGTVSSRGALTRLTGGESFESLQALLAQANLCRIRRQWDRAIEYCIAVLQAHPGNQTAHALLGDIYRDQGKLDDAIQWYRMAVELGPNPADEARLRQMEQERARLVRAQNARLTGQGLSTALDADGSVRAGTTQLMGLSPRSWLTGMTLLATGFATVMLAALIGLKAGQRASGTATTPVAGVPSAAVTPQNSPSTQSATASRDGAGTASETRPGASPPAGSGLRPDASVPGALATTTTPSTSGTARTPQNLPPAPVLRVQPLPAPPASVRGAVRPEGGTEPAMQAPLPLSDGMYLARVHQDPVSQTVSLLVTSPLTISAATTAMAREQMVRNVYRAARAFFALHPHTQRVTVYVQEGLNPGIASPTLLLATVDRTAAHEADPDRDDLRTLEQALEQLRVVAMPQDSTSSHDLSTSNSDV